MPDNTELQQEDTSWRTPRPDPTLLTTQQLFREIALLREFLENKANCIRELTDERIKGLVLSINMIEERIAAMAERSRSDLDKSQELYAAKFGCSEVQFIERMKGFDQAVVLLNDRVNTLFSAQTERTHEEFKRFQDLQTEKFDSVELQFKERDIRTSQLDVGNKEAIHAALTSSKELVGVQNVANAAAFAKSEENFSRQIDQIQKILDTITKSTEDKITDLKTRVDTAEGKKTGGSENWSMIMGLAGVGISLITLMILFLHNTGGTVPGAH